MNPLILFIAGGHSFWVGVLLISLIAVNSSRKRSLLILKTIALLAGLILIAVSMTPIPYWWYAMLGVAAVYWMWIFRRKKSLPDRESMAVAGFGSAS